MRSVAAVVLFCIAAPLSAATFTVSNAGDSGTGSLRWAIGQSNATPGRDEIVWSDRMTVTLQSPLPPITDPVTIGVNPLPYWGGDVPQPPLLTIDGSRASGEGLHIWADNVVVSSVALVHFKNSDAIIIEGNDAILAWVSEDDAANGLRIRGLRAGIYGSGFDDNQDAGLVIESSSHDNTIGRLRSGCPPVGAPCDVSPAGNHFDRNDVGMRVDGAHNTFIFTEASANRTDGAVITGPGNPLDSVYAIGNVRNGATLLAPATPPLVVSCNGVKPFEVSADFRLPPPQIAAATRYQTLITAGGEAHAAPNRKVLVSLYALVSSQLDCGVFLGQIGSASATTDAAGKAHFDINAPFARAEALYAAVTELDADGNATATSELSAPFNPATNVEPTADMSVEIAAPPSVVYGQEITIVTRVTNHGPGASVPYTVSFPLGVGLVYLDNFCSVCQEPPLAPGQTAVIEQRVRVLGRGTALPYRAEVRGYGLNDPNSANNDATIVVAIGPAPPRRRGVLH